MQSLYTVRQFAEAEPAFSEAAIRNLLFKSESRQSSKGELMGNGLAQSGAIVRIGRKILIDRQKFIAWTHLKESA